jgi:hypothetical protein
MVPTLPCDTPLAQQRAIARNMTVRGAYGKIMSKPSFKR